MKRTISTDDAPAAVGAYSQAATDGSLVFTAGQVALTPDGEAKNDAPIREQTRQCLANLQGVLESEGLGTDDILKTTVFIADIDDYGAIDEAYADFFDDEPPARSAVGVDELPKGFGVEIQAVASLE